MLATIKGYWAKVPNWLQSLIFALVIAGGQYAFSTDHTVTLEGLEVALFVAAGNWWNTHVGHLVGRTDAIVAVVQKTVPPTN